MDHQAKPAGRFWLAACFYNEYVLKQLNPLISMLLEAGL